MRHRRPELCALAEAAVEKHANGEKCIPTLRHPEGVSSADWLFDEVKIAALVVEWQKSGDVELYRQIVLGTKPFVQSVVGMFIQAGNPNDYGDACQDCYIKLRVLFRKFRPEQGRLFALLNRGLKNFLIARDLKRQVRARYVASLVEERRVEVGADNVRQTAENHDFERLWNGITTRFTTPAELEIQRFILAYFREHGKFPTLALLRSKFKASGLAPRQYPLLRNYLQIRLRMVFECEVEPIVIRCSVMAKTREILGDELFAKLCCIFGGVSVQFPTRLNFFVIQRRESEKSFRFWREHLEPEPEPVRLFPPPPNFGITD
jgi:hypothetical protein